MLRRFVTRVAYGACILAALTSCGDEKAHGTGEFTTVYAIATPPAGATDVDIRTWSGTACDPASTFTITPTDLNFTITSIPYNQANTGQTSTITTSDLVVTSITLTYTPANTSTPALPLQFQTQYPSAGFRIAPGDNSIPVRIGSDEMKAFLLNGLGSQSLNCSNNAIYAYRVSASFQAVEVNTNRVSTITTPGFLLVNFADFNDAGA